MEQVTLHVSGSRQGAAMEKTRCVPIQNEKVAWMPVTEETTQDYTKKTAIMVFKVEHLTKGKKTRFLTVGEP